MVFYKYLLYRQVFSEDRHDDGENWLVSDDYDNWRHGIESPNLQGELVDNGFGVNVPCEEEKCGNKCVSEVIKALINNISNVKQIGIKSTQAMLNTYPELIDTYSFSRGNSCFQVWHRFYDDNWQGRMVELCTGVSLNNISSTIMTGAPTKAPTGSSPPTTQTQISWYPHQMWNIFIVSVLTRSTASRGSSPGW